MPAVPAARVAVVAVWVLTLIGVVLIDVFVPDPHALSWLALALPLAVVAGIVASQFTDERASVALWRLPLTADERAGVALCDGGRDDDLVPGVSMQAPGSTADQPRGPPRVRHVVNAVRIARDFR